MHGATQAFVHILRWEKTESSRVVSACAPPYPLCSSATIGKNERSIWAAAESPAPLLCGQFLIAEKTEKPIDCRGITGTSVLDCHSDNGTGTGKESIRKAV